MGSFLLEKTNARRFVKSADEQTRSNLVKDHVSVWGI